MDPPQAKKCLFSSFAKKSTMFLICLIKLEVARTNVWLPGTGPDKSQRKANLCRQDASVYPSRPMTKTDKAGFLLVDSYLMT